MAAHRGQLAFGRLDSCVWGRVPILKETRKRLTADPLAETGQMRTLRPNPVAQRELRLFGKYRVLLNVDAAGHAVEMVLVGEKRGNALIVQGREFVAHHESDSTQ